MWGVRRRDAAGHNESGWLIRPEMRSSSSSPSVFFILIFYFISHSHLPVYVQTNKRSLVLPACPGQYGSVSGDGACPTSDDLVHRIYLG
jgi:hypothetical protein